MRTALQALMPEVLWITDPGLRETCIDTWLLALDESGTSAEDFTAILCHKSLDGCPLTLLDHTRGVVRLAKSIAANLTADLGRFVHLDMDLVIMSALLHDVGKVLEHVRDDRGELTWAARHLHHPITGAVLAARCHCPPEVVYVIANHSHEGREAKDTPELFVVRSADDLYYRYLFFGFEKKKNPGWQ